MERFQRQTACGPTLRVRRSSPWNNPIYRRTNFALKSTFVSVSTIAMLMSAPADSFADTSKTRWENHVSRHCTFTLLKPVGWIVKESYQDDPRMWTFSVTEPNGRCQVASAHGASPQGRDADALIRGAVADMFKQYPASSLLRPLGGGASISWMPRGKRPAKR